jgi:uncharacterized damage-inducible protein DinB
MMKTEIEFLNQTSDRFKEGFDRIFKAINQLDERQTWMRPSSESNSVGIILQHLIGNLNQWVCAGAGGTDFQRNRPEEFRDQQHSSKDEIVQKFLNLGEAVKDVISRVKPDSLHSPIRIQNTEVTVMSALYKAVTHFEFHEGQILYIAKLLLNEKYQGIWGPKTTP